MTDSDQIPVPVHKNKKTEPQFVMSLVYLKCRFRNQFANKSEKANKMAWLFWVGVGYGYEVGSYVKGVV